MGVAEYRYDKRLFRSRSVRHAESLNPVVGAIHELPLPQVSYLNSAMPIYDPELAYQTAIFHVDNPIGNIQNPVIMSHH
jgi:hypothetical protein